MTQIRINIPQEIAVKTKEAVVKKLGVKDAFKLNDRLDGVMYYNKMLKRIIGAFCIEKEFKIELVNKINILQSKIEFNLTQKYNILVYKADEPILIPKLEETIFIVIKLAFEYKKAILLGQISSEECAKHCKLSDSNSFVSKNSLGVLTDLSHLQKIHIV